MGQKKTLSKKLAKARNFEILFCVIFESYDPNFISERETGQQALYLGNFEVFPISTNFLRSYILSCSPTRESSSAPLPVNQTYTKMNLEFRSYRIKKHREISKIKGKRGYSLVISLTSRNRCLVLALKPYPKADAKFV